MISLIMTFSLVACNDNKTKNDTVIDKKGTYDTEETVKNIKITADEVILSNKVIEGDLQIDVPGLSGDLTLDNVTVNGKIIVNDPQQEYIIRMYDVKAAAMEVNNESNLLKLLASKGTSIPSLSAKGSISLTEQALVGNGFHDVVVSGKSALISLLGAGINQLTVNDSENSTVNIDPETLVMNLVANGPLKIAGKGIVEKLIAKANVDFETEPKNMEIQDGVLVNGTEYGVTTPATTTTTAKVTSATTTKKTTTKPVTTTKPATTVTTTTPVVTSPVNTAPIITAADVTIKTGETFNPLSGVTIYDKEDGGYITVLTSHIQSNTVDLSKTGTYTVVYAYTDKGGLKTTYSRKVTVEQGNKLSAPQNVKVYLDSYGDVVLEWDPVANAGSYDIYFNKTQIDNVSGNRTKYILDSADITQTRDFDLGVRAISKSKDIKDSDISYGTFKYVKSYIDIPTYVYSSKEIVSMAYKPSPIGIKDNKTYAIITVSLDGSRLQSHTILPGVKTDRYGVAEVEYNRDKGLKFETIFDSVGEYTIQILIEDNTGQLSKEVFSVDSRNGGSGNSGGSISYTKPENIRFTAHQNWSTGATLKFKLNKDLDLRNDNADLYVEFVWSVRDGNEGVIVKHISTVTDATVLVAGEDITFILNSSVSGSRVISQELDNNKTVYVSANIIVIDQYGIERASKTSLVSFE